MPPKKPTYNRYKRKSYSKKPRVSPAATKALVKNTLLKMAETNYKSHDVKGQGFYHDTLARHDLWSPTSTDVNSIWPLQNDSDSGRNGDMIQVAGIKIRGVFEVPNDRFNAKMKLYFVQWNSSDGTPTNQNEFFHNVSGNIMIDPIQNKRFRSVTKLGMIQCRATDVQQGTAQTKTIFFSKWIPMNKKVYFKGDGSENPTNLKEYGSILFCPYDTISSVTTDMIIVNSELTYTIYYKDI